MDGKLPPDEKSRGFVRQKRDILCSHRSSAWIFYNCVVALIWHPEKWHCMLSSCFFQDNIFQAQYQAHGHFFHKVKPTCQMDDILWYRVSYLTFTVIIYAAIIVAMLMKYCRLNKVPTFLAPESIRLACRCLFSFVPFSQDTIPHRPTF